MDIDTCDFCGSPVIVTDLPDGIKVSCTICGMVDFIWKDDDYDDN